MSAVYQQKINVMNLIYIVIINIRNYFETQVLWVSFDQVFLNGFIPYLESRKILLGRKKEKTSHLKGPFLLDLEHYFLRGL